jgi:MHS family proline/betaine transporter-like MFS transporter
MNDDDESQDSRESYFDEAAPAVYHKSSLHETLKTVAGVAGNVLEWYDFAVFGFFSDILGQVFFPKDQPEELSVMESFAVFGGAFLMRPVGGIVIGYIGDVSGRKKALEISLFLMAFATTLMGCLPTYDQVGNSAILLLLMVRMLQGLSVGGQLMSSLVFTLESRPTNRWGLYGSCVMAAGNFGTFLGGVVAYGLRSNLTNDQLTQWGWRIPFLSGILISVCGIYLKYFCEDDEILPGHAPVPVPSDDMHDRAPPTGQESQEDDQAFPSEYSANNNNDNAINTNPTTPVNPLREAFSRENRRSLIASCMVPMVWSGGFYLSFVWMAIYMTDLIDPPVPSAFGVNSYSLLLLILWFPLAGLLSDYYGRKRIMTIGGVAFGLLGPIMMFVIGEKGSQSAWIAFTCQTVLSISLTLWGAPMCAWLVESFEPQARLTSVSIGYNIAQAIAGGMSPFLATLLVDKVGLGAPGVLLFFLSVVSIAGLWVIAPPQRANDHCPIRSTEEPQEDFRDEIHHELELKEIS